MLRLPYPKRAFDLIRSFFAETPKEEWDDKAVEAFGLSATYLNTVLLGHHTQMSNRTAMNLGFYPVLLDMTTGEIIVVPVPGQCDIEEMEWFRKEVGDKDFVIAKLDMEDVNEKLHRHRL